MTLTHLRDQLDKYSMAIALDYLTKALQDDASVRRLMGMNATFREVCSPHRSGLQVVHNVHEG